MVHREHPPTLVDDRAEARGGEKRRDARAARPDALRKRPLRRQLHLQLAREILPLKLGVLADVPFNLLINKINGASA